MSVLRKWLRCVPMPVSFLTTRISADVFMEASSGRCLERVLTYIFTYVREQIRKCAKRSLDSHAFPGEVVLVFIQKQAQCLQENVSGRNHTDKSEV